MSWPIFADVGRWLMRAEKGATSAHEKSPFNSGGVSSSIVPQNLTRKSRNSNGRGCRTFILNEITEESMTINNVIIDIYHLPSTSSGPHQLSGETTKRREGRSMDPSTMPFLGGRQTLNMVIWLQLWTWLWFRHFPRLFSPVSHQQQQPRIPSWIYIYWIIEVWMPLILMKGQPFFNTLLGAKKVSQKLTRNS